jgi:drug/metabolite transporter (DMT)-like permease
VTLFLFLSVVFAWGLTWYGITLQIGVVPDDVSVFWRFLLSSIVLWTWLAATGRLRRTPVRQHIWFAALGLALFSCNFLFFYAAESYVPSGIVSVVFSMATIFNVLNQRIFLGIRPGRRVLIGAAFGSVGVALLFSGQVFKSNPHAGMSTGLLLALCGTYFFSIGNLVSRRAARDGTSLPNAVARGMAWGTFFLGLAVATHHESFVPGLSPSYIGALLYLVLIGTVFGFVAYLSLVGRIGPERAAFVTVLSPIIAVGLSTWLEGDAWNWTTILGLPIILSGSVIIFLPTLMAVMRGRSAKRGLVRVG